jgi:hypothetical protein
MATPKNKTDNIADAAVSPIVGPPTPIINPIPIPSPVPIPIPIPIPVPIPPVTNATPLSPSNPSVTTAAPTSRVSVTVPNSSGSVTFSLVVTEYLGVKSSPALATVTIQGAPVAVIAATPSTVAPGGAIQLAGGGSTSSGSIASYTFSLVPPPASPVN